MMVHLLSNGKQAEVMVSEIADTKGLSYCGIRHQRQAQRTCIRIR